MNFLNLKYFLVCAEELNFTRAAKRLYISQQSLSNHIKKLEDEFGIQLFRRGPHITLTEAGNCLYHNAKQLLAMQRKTENQMLDIKDFRSGEITIGIGPTRGAVMLPPIIKAYHHQYPQVYIHVFEGDNNEIVEALITGKVDLIIGFETENELSVSEYLFTEYQYIVVHDGILKSYFTSEQQEEILASDTHKLETFSACPFVLPHVKTLTGQIFQNIAKKTNMNVKVAVQTYGARTMLTLAQAGIGVCLCSATLLQNSGYTADAPIHCFKLDDSLSGRRVAISIKKNTYHTKALKEFIRITKEIFGP